MSTSGPTDPRPVVLVHGLWHQAAHLAPLVDRLAERGVDARAVELHRGSLDEDTAAVQAVVEGCGTAPVVLGHSYGGSVVTGLTGVHHLVHLAAFVPSDGESSASLAGPRAPVKPAVRLRDDGATEIDPALARYHLYADCTEEAAERAISLLVPQAPANTRGIPRRFSWREVPSTYLVCAEDRAVDPGLQRRMAERCGSVVTLRASHSAYLSRTDDVAATLTELAARA